MRTCSQSTQSKAPRNCGLRGVRNRRLRSFPRSLRLRASRPRSQSVTFDRCQLDVSGAAGLVECRGVTTYVPLVGEQRQRTESRQWTFRVRRGGDGWVITSAAAR